MCGLGRVGRVNSSSRTFLGCCFGSGAAGPYIFTGPQGCSSTGAAPGLEKCKGDMPMANVRKNSAKLTREDLKITPESPTMKRQELAVPCEFSVRNSMVISDETSDQTPAVEPSDQTSKTVRHAPLVYRVEEIAQLLAISNRAAGTAGRSDDHGDHGKRCRTYLLRESGTAVQSGVRVFLQRKVK